MKVHILRKFESDVIKLLRSQLDSKIELTFGSDVPSEARCEILVAGRPNRDMISGSPNIRAVIVPYAGVPKDTLELMRDYPQIKLHNLHHNALPTAELAISLLLSAAKLIVPYDQSLRRGDWRPRYQPAKTILLKGKMALVIGYGHIGRHVANYCESLGMHVCCIRRHVNLAHSNQNDGRVYPVEALSTQLPEANALIVTLPLTPETENLIGHEEIAALPDGALVVNVGRGKIINQEALYRGLVDGRLAAAGLDVWYNYPEDEDGRGCTYPADYPFHELDNVVMSPHRGGATRETESLRMTHLAVLLNAAARGESMPNRVDVQAGY